MHNSCSVIILYIFPYLQKVELKFQLKLKPTLGCSFCINYCSDVCLAAATEASINTDAALRSQQFIRTNTDGG